MKKIGVYLAGRPNNGGSYQYWLSIVKALSEIDKNRFEVCIYSSFSDWEKYAKTLNMKYVQLNNNQSLFEKGVSFLYNRFPNQITKKIFCKFNKNIRYIKEQSLDLWIAQTVNGVGDLLGVPSMIPIFDLMHRYEKFPELFEKYEEREKLYKYQCLFADTILVDSLVGKQQVIECYGDEKKSLEEHIEILPFIPPDYVYGVTECNVVDLNIFDKYIFYPAQFWMHKNHKNLIKAIELLKQQGIDIHAIFVGSEQNNQQKIQDMIIEKNLSQNIRVLGYVSNDEMVYLYKHARALVMPTFFGPTNIPQLEAFVLECPVATSKIYGIPDQVKDAALLFDPNSVEEIADCINRLWQDDELCRKLIERGKKRADEWNQKHFTMKLISIIEKKLEKVE